MDVLFMAPTVTTYC